MEELLCTCCLAAAPGGLAVSRKILREHGGEITVESEPGQGSRFLLSWPRHPEEEHRGFDNKTAY